MAESRDAMLADFQAFTGIEDVAEALAHLEYTNWDLLRAVNRAIPDDTQNRTNDSSPDIEMIEEVPNPNKNSRKFSVTEETIDDDDDPIICSDPPTMRTQINRLLDMPSFPSTSHSLGSPPLRFVIEHETQRHKIEIPATATVLDLKKKIQEASAVPVCRQALTGCWKTPRSDSVRLFSMSLGPVTRLRLRDTSSEGFMGVDVVQRMRRNFTLNITYEGTGQTFPLPFPGTTSILDVKTNMVALTNVPVRHQVWTGWPSSLTDDSLTLAASGIGTIHDLSMKSTEVKDDAKKQRRVQQVEDSDDSSIEEFEDVAENLMTGDDDIFPDTRRKLQPLIPENVEDEVVGCLQFADEFSSRYGPLHPEFFPGGLEDAIKEACMKPARERRLLALYLHHDGSVLANVFCTQLLCCDSVIEILATYFVLWGWDLTFLDNQQKFINSFTKGLGAMAVMQIKNIPVERLPAIIIISKVRSNIEIMSVIHGNVGVNDIMASLTETVDVFLNQQKVEVREEEDRAAREMILMQQDAAYRESLETDRAKEEARKEQERLETQEKEKEELQRKQEATRKEVNKLDSLQEKVERIAVEARLPDEPPEKTENITKIRVRLPKGEFLERRFRAVEPLQTLLDWLHTCGFPSTEFKLLSSWPRRDLSSGDATHSFKDLSLCPQETVILEER